MSAIGGWIVPFLAVILAAVIGVIQRRRWLWMTAAVVGILLLVAFSLLAAVQGSGTVVTLGVVGG